MCQLTLGIFCHDRSHIGKHRQTTDTHTQINRGIYTDRHKENQIQTELEGKMTHTPRAGLRSNLYVSRNLTWASAADKSMTVSNLTLANPFKPYQLLCKHGKIMNMNCKTISKVIILGIYFSVLFCLNTDFNSDWLPCLLIQLGQFL